jgi:1-deoxy-D-xylulose-5-phosphate reductoisomerase
VAQGSDSGAVLNSADEVAVQAFLDHAIDFHDIYRVNARVLSRRPGLDGDFSRLLEADAQARRMARETITSLSNTRAAR